MIWAQVGVEIEWVRTVVNFGSFGLVAYMIMYQFPVMMKRFLDMQDRQTAEITSMRTAFGTTLTSLQDSFSRNLVTMQQMFIESQKAAALEFRTEIEAVRTRADARAEKISMRVGGVQESLIREWEKNEAALQRFTEVMIGLQTYLRQIHGEKDDRSLTK